MSGYQSTELIIANVDGPVSSVLTGVREYLVSAHDSRESECYVIQDPQGPKGPNECYEPLEPDDDQIAEAIAIGYGARLDYELRIGTYTHLAMLCAVPAGARLSLTLKLESSVIDAVYRYDRSLNDFDEEAKRGLIQLCIGLTATVGAKGFLLQRDQKRISPIEAEEIAPSVRARARPWSIAGVSDELLSMRDLQRSEETKDPKYIYASVTGLTIYDLVHPIGD